MAIKKLWEQFTQLLFCPTCDTYKKSTVMYKKQLDEKGKVNFQIICAVGHCQNKTSDVEHWKDWIVQGENSN